MVFSAMRLIMSSHCAEDGGGARKLNSLFQPSRHVKPQHVACQSLISKVGNPAPHLLPAVLQLRLQS